MIPNRPPAGKYLNVGAIPGRGVMAAQFEPRPPRTPHSNHYNDNDNYATQERASTGPGGSNEQEPTTPYTSAFNSLINVGTNQGHGEVGTGTGARAQAQPQPQTPKMNYGDWQEEPSYEDQYLKYPETCKTVGPQIAVYDLSQPEQLEALNTLLSKQAPDTCPRLIVADQEKEFSTTTDNWKILVVYYKVLYRKLISSEPE